MNVQSDSRKKLVSVGPKDMDARILAQEDGPTPKGRKTVTSMNPNCKPPKFPLLNAPPYFRPLPRLGCLVQSWAYTNRLKHTM